MLLISGVLIALLIGEAFCRFGGHYLTFAEQCTGKPYFSLYEAHTYGWLRVMPPNMTIENNTKEFKYKVSSNSLGLPDREYSLNKPSHTFRIAAFGDSFTEGFGAVADSSWPRLLQRLLSKTVTDSVEVMNCGISGSDPVFEYMLLKQKMMAYHPDMVIFAINESDMTDIVYRGGMERFQKDGTVKYTDPPYWEWIYAHSFLFRRIIIDGLRYHNSLLTQKEYKRRFDNSINVLDQVVDSISILCRQNNCSLILAFDPISWDIRNQKMTVTPVLNYASMHGIKTVDILNTFLKQGVDTSNLYNYYWPIDGHNKPEGYLLIARAVAEQIEREKSFSKAQ